MKNYECNDTKVDHASWEQLLEPKLQTMVVLGGDLK